MGVEMIKYEGRLAVPGKELITLPTDGSGGSIDEDREAVEELANAHRP